MKNNRFTLTAHLCASMVHLFHPHFFLCSKKKKTLQTLSAKKKFYIILKFLNQVLCVGFFFPIMTKCLHDKRKLDCRICTPARFCAHNKRKANCSICTPTNFCEHGRSKTRCVDCGIGLCPHGEPQKSVCRECNGSSLCIHSRVKSKCKTCKGSAFCLHGRRKATCTLCKTGPGVCAHGRVRAICKDCIGTSICVHGRRKSRCSLCGTGSELCSHNQDKYKCRECGGGNYCEHDRRHKNCKSCGGSALYNIPFCEVVKNPLYKPYCARCFIFLNPDSPICFNYKTKEIAVKDFILTRFPGLTWIHDKRLPDACSLRRPDLSLDLGSHVLFIEVEENGHDLGYSCGNKRTCELWKDAAYRPCVFLRINPNAYTTDSGQKIRSCWKHNSQGVNVISDEKAWHERLLALDTLIGYYIANVPRKSILVESLFFTVTTPNDNDEKVYNENDHSGEVCDNKNICIDKMYYEKDYIDEVCCKDAENAPQTSIIVEPLLLVAVKTPRNDENGNVSECKQADEKPNKQQETMSNHNCKKRKKQLSLDYFWNRK